MKSYFYNIGSTVWVGTLCLWLRIGLELIVRAINNIITKNPLNQWQLLVLQSKKLKDCYNQSFSTSTLLPKFCLPKTFLWYQPCPQLAEDVVGTAKNVSSKRNFGSSVEVLKI